MRTWITARAAGRPICGALGGSTRNAWDVGPRNGRRSMKLLPCGLLLIFALTAGGCSGLAPRNAPTYAPSAPTLVRGRVIELRKQGAWIDFDSAFVSYDSVVVEILEPVD